MSILGLDVAIIGGGIGGLTAAIALAQRGAMVRVFEQASEIKEVGAGIQISPNGFCVLRAMGLADQLLAQSVRGEAVELRDYKQGRLVTRLDLNRLGEEQRYSFIHRADLIEILKDAAIAAGVEINVGHRAISVTNGSKREITFENGSTVSAAIIVCADGLQSIGRKALNGTEAPFFTQQVAWRTIVPNVIDHPPAARVHMGPKRHVVSYPLRDGAMVNLVAVQEQASWTEESWAGTDTMENTKSVFADFSPEVLTLMNEAQNVGKWGLFRHEVADVWHDDNIVLLGDAAHPTLPFMAQGAVMAIEDAWVLAASIAETDTVAAGLASYHASRRDRVTKIVNTATGNARKYHLSFPPLRMAAHTAMRIAGAVAPGKLLGQFDWIYRHDVTK